MSETLGALTFLFCLVGFITAVLGPMAGHVYDSEFRQLSPHLQVLYLKIQTWTWLPYVGLVLVLYFRHAQSEDKIRKIEKGEKVEP